MDRAKELQKVINTLKLLEIPATYDNVRYMTGIYQTLLELRDAENEMKLAEGGETDGEGDGI